MDDLIKKPDSAIEQRKQFSLIVWSPTPLKKPEIDQNFENLPPIPRASESIRYNIACLEYFISPNGALRESFKICLGFTLLLIFAAMPATVLVFVALKLEMVAISLLKTAAALTLALVIFRNLIRLVF